LKDKLKKKIVRVNAIAIAEMLKAAQEGVCTSYELKEISGLNLNTVRGYMNVFHKAGVVHICDWEEDPRGNRTRKVYKLGKGKDMPKPKQSMSEINRRYREKMKQIKLMKELDAIKTLRPATSTRRINKTLAANQSSIASRA
jgi:transcription initiation factor IIE alpha subunit